MERIIISVTNDLTTDQRIKKICNSLLDLNFEIVLIGRKLPDSLPLSRKYKTIRMRLLFKKGFLFYAEYSIRLFLKLFFLRKDTLLANDLDTLLPNYLISKIFSKKLVYDSHELFTEIPELISRPKIRSVWLYIENYIFPKLKNVYTVNSKIAEFYTEKYHVPVKVIRNIAPKLTNQKIDVDFSKKIKGSNKMLILQGTGINIDRGAEEAVLMMQYLDHIILYIIGSGDVFEDLKKIINKYNLDNKVFLKTKIPYQSLLKYTKIADLGLSLDKGTNLNYEYSLPNKVFDYIQCQIPILTSNREVLTEFISENTIGVISTSHEPKKLAETVRTIFSDRKKYSQYKENLKSVSKIFTWENESKKLKEIFLDLK